MPDLIRDHVRVLNLLAIIVAASALSGCSHSPLKAPCAALSMVADVPCTPKPVNR